MSAAWIRMISDSEADGELQSALDDARTPHGTVDNVLRVHSLRPHTMRGHMSLYKSVLHHPDNSLSPLMLELAGTYCSILNNCEYSVIHHSSNLKRLYGDDSGFERAIAALREGKLDDGFEGKELVMLQYVEKLTTRVSDMEKQDYIDLIASGCTDEEVLELNQVVGYFCYVNRLLNGLGVTTEGDVIGYY